jgi:hypothetical protein
MLVGEADGLPRIENIAEEKSHADTRYDLAKDNVVYDTPADTKSRHGLNGVHGSE